MSENAVSVLTTFLSNLPSEFWAAIAGALVGGLITILIQAQALREQRRQREEDRKQVQKSLAHGLLFKMISIHSGFHRIHQHFEQAFKRAEAKNFKGEPWQFVQPYGNPPVPVRFSTEEMAMLLELKDNQMFNSIAGLDDIHNSLSSGVGLLTAERNQLTDRFKNEQFDGSIGTSFLTNSQHLELRPQMIEVNSLIEQLRSEAKQDFDQSKAALARLEVLLRDKVGLEIKLAPKIA
jgi:hypothetical protein